MTNHEHDDPDPPDMPGDQDQDVPGEPERLPTPLDEHLRDLVEPPFLRSIREQEAFMRNIVDPPALQAIREQEAFMRNIVDPPALRAIREQEEFMRNIVDPPALRAIREHEELMRNVVDPPALRAIREQEELMRNIVDPPALRAIREHQELMRDLVDPPALRAIREQQELLRELVHLPALSENVFARSAEFLGRGVGLVESALRLGHMDDYASTVGVAALGISRLAAAGTGPIFQPVQELLQTGLDFLEQPFDALPANLLAHVPAELFRALDLDGALQGTIESPAESERAYLASRTADELEASLASRDAELVSLLQGARQALHSANADRARHVCISLRELLGHALRRLAPDNEVKAWSRDPVHYHNGRPTRKARLEYLFGSVADAPLRRLIAADIRAAIELFDVLSEGAHAANMGMSSAALMLLMTRAEGVLLFLLRLGVVRDGDA